MSNVRPDIHPSDAAKAAALMHYVYGVDDFDKALAIYNAFLMQPKGADFVDFVDQLSPIGGIGVYDKYARSWTPNGIWATIVEDALCFANATHHFEARHAKQDRQG